MKKFLSKVFATVIGLTVALGGVGCINFDPDTGTSEDPPINTSVDTDRTQLNVGVYDGGLGMNWTRAVADAFEEKYADVEFEEGKKGVQVMIYGKGEKANYEPGVLIPNIQNKIETNDVYLTANSDLKQFVNAGICEDLTDLLEKDVYGEDGNLADDLSGIDSLANGIDDYLDGINGTNSLLDRMDDYFVDAYQWKDENYYAFPFEDSTFGIVYDADLFEKRKWEVPETMEQFYTLLDKMKNSNITPFTWTGVNNFYFTPITTAIVAQYEGIEGANQNLFYNGTFNGTPITDENAYLLAGQQGKLEALKFFRKITSDTRYYSNMAFGSSQGHLDAQAEFLLSVERASNGAGNRIAMILEGEWWENEARGTFNEMASSDESMGYGKRNFRFMPMPYIEGQKSDKRIIVSFTNGSVGFVNKNSKNKDLAKLWVLFMHQNSSLATFTTHTGAVLPYEYELTKEQYDSLTPFAQSVWDVRHDEDVQIYRTMKTGDFAAYGDIKMGGAGREIVMNDSVTNALRGFYDNPKLTAEEYFENSKKYYEEKWPANYQKYKEQQKT